MTAKPDKIDLGRVVDELARPSCKATAAAPGRAGARAPTVKGPRLAATDARVAGATDARVAGAIDHGLDLSRLQTRIPDRASEFVGAEEAGLWRVVSSDGSTSPCSPPRRPVRVVPEGTEPNHIAARAPQSTDAANDEAPPDPPERNLRLLRAMTNLPPTNVGPRATLGLAGSRGGERRGVEMPRGGSDPSAWLRSNPPNPPSTVPQPSLPVDDSDSPPSEASAIVAEPIDEPASVPPQPTESAASEVAPIREPAPTAESAPAPKTKSSWLTRLPCIGARPREIDARLARVIDHWPSLPRSIQTAMLAMIDAES